VDDVTKLQEEFLVMYWVFQWTPPENKYYCISLLSNQRTNHILKKNMSFIHQSKLFLFCHEIRDFFIEKHNVLLSETLFMNIAFLLNFLTNSKQLLILTINANVLSNKKKSFMNISFLQNSLINIHILNCSNVPFFFSHRYTYCWRNR
jgi:hypothetical protein